MIKQFKSNIALVYAFSILLVLATSAEIFLESSTSKYSFFDWYSDFLVVVENNTLFDYALTIIFLVVTSYFIIRSFNKTSFYSKNSAFPILIFVVVSNAFQGFHFGTHFVVDLLFALSFLRIIDLDQNKSAIHVSFLSGILLGISFLFSIWLLPVGLVIFYSLLTFRPFKWREWLISFVGMGIPTLYLFSIRYLFYSNYTFVPRATRVVSSEVFWFDYLNYLLLGLLIISALVGLRSQFKFLSNIERKQINILGFFTAITVSVSAGIFWIYNIEYYVFIVPLTLLISLPILNSKQDKFVNVLLFGLIVLNLLRIFVFS